MSSIVSIDILGLTRELKNEGMNESLAEKIVRELKKLEDFIKTNAKIEIKEVKDNIKAEIIAEVKLDNQILDTDIQLIRKDIEKISGDIRVLEGSIDTKISILKAELLAEIRLNNSKIDNIGWWVKGIALAVGGALLKYLFFTATIN